MNLKQLTYLTVLHSAGSFTLAAKRCGVSQSTLSSGIASLEAYLGTALVERDTQHLYFTEVGQGVVARALPLLASVQDLQSYASQGAKPMQGSLTLGAIPSIAPFLLSQVMKQLSAQYPDLRVFLRELQTADLLAQLRSGALDMGVIALPYDTQGFNVSPLFEEPLMLITSANDALATVTLPTLAHLDAERLILLQEGHCLRDHTLQSCSVRERSTAAIEASSLHTLVQMVAAGLGVALLPAMAVRSYLVTPYVQDGSIVAHGFAHPSPQRGVALVTRLSHTQAQTLAVIAELAKQSQT